MNQLALNWPSSLQSQDEQIEAIQKAFSDIQKGVNANATQPLVLLHLPTATMNNSQSQGGGSYATIPGWSWTINSQGGLVMIDAIVGGYINTNGTGSVALLIDGKVVLEQRTTDAVAPFAMAFHWGAVLGVGQHTISFASALKSPGGGLLIVVNGTTGGSVSSTVGIVEFPSNIQNIDVSAA
jgi:hypothetical protein